MRRALLLSALMLAIPASAQAERTLMDRIAAVVDDELILISEVDERIEAIFPGELSQVSDPVAREAERIELRNGALDQLIAEKLIRQAVVEDQILITAEEVTQQIQQIAKENSMSVDELKGALLGQGTSMPEFRRDMKEQMEYQRFLGMEIYGRVSVGEDQIRSVYEQRKASASTAKLMRLQQLRVPVTAGSGPDQEMPEVPEVPIDVVLAALAGGQDFDEVARIYSNLPGVTESGSAMLPLDPSQLREPFRSAIADLELDQVSEPSKVGDSFWLFKLVGYESEPFPQFDEVKAALANELRQAEVERQLERWVERRRLRTHLEIKL